jgi:hypothetical protein
VPTLGRIRHRAVPWLTLSLLLGCNAADRGRDATSSSEETTGADETGTEGPTEEPGEFGEEQTFELRIDDTSPPPLVLEMNRDEVAELFGDSAHDVLLLELDTEPLLTNTLEQVKLACGTGWMLDDPDPKHDCSVTTLGQTFQGADGTWQTSAEYAMVRLLTMTPANVVVDGTSSQSLRNLADALNIGGGYSQILADALGIARTTPVVSTEAMVASFKENFVATHPETTDEGAMRFTLADALSDLATMTSRHGPAGGHPGVIDPSFPVHGEVFGHDFQMRAVAESNLRIVEGVDGDQGKGYMTIVVDEIGPTYDDALEFDFLDPERFSLQGIQENLTVDLRFKLYEDSEFIWSCTGDPPCQANEPGNPVDGNSVWAVEPWLIEYNIAAAARNRYIDRVFYGSYALGGAKIYIGQDGNPPGWIQYETTWNLGSPPDDQWLWETVLEVGQVALHETPYATFPEGDANVGFTMRDVSVGISGAEAAEAVRPFLQDQSAALSDILLGDYKKHNDRLDFYYRRASNGELYLFFVAPSDLRDGEPYEYLRPGFFRTSSLLHDEKVSSKTVVGLVDTEHEKLHVPPGELVVYYEDDGGLVYRVRVHREEGASDATVGIAQGVRGG